MKVTVNSMLLTDREWKEFYIKEIFITKSKKKPQVPTGAYVHRNFLKKGNTPRITVTSQNNGIDGYWTSNDKNYRVFENFISVSFLGTIFYHPYAASLDMKVHCLKLIGKTLNTYTSKFLISEIKKSIENASYGNQLSSTDFPNKKVMLPINDNSEPDYDFMEAFVKEQEQVKKQEYIAYAKNIVSTLKYKKIEPLEDKKWIKFPVNSLFAKIIAGKSKGLNHLTQTKSAGGVNYIGATHRNNGVLCQVKLDDTTKKMLQKGNCIGFIRNGNGSVGYAIYKTEKFISTSDVSFAYSSHMNKFVALFITTSSNLIRGKYNHNYKRTPKRLQNDCIMLPIDKEGKPDYGYMEQYINNIMVRKYSDYLGRIS